MGFANWPIEVAKDTTSFILPIDIMTSAVTPATGLDDTDFGNVSYSRPDQGDAGATTVTLSAGTRGTWSSGGFVEKDATNAKGVYEFGVPDAALATGADWVLFTFQNSGNTEVVCRVLIWLRGNINALIAGQTDSGVISPSIFDDPLNVNVVSQNGLSCERLYGTVKASPSPTASGFTIVLSSSSSAFVSAGENLLVDYTLQCQAGAFKGLGGRISGNGDGDAGGTDIALTFDPPLKFTPVADDPFAITLTPVVARKPSERLGTIASTDDTTFTVAFVPDIPEAAFGQQALDQFAGCRLRLEVLGSVSDGGTPGVEIPILASEWGAGYSVTLQLPNTAFVALIIDNIVDARASIVGGAEAWQYQSPTWPILRLKVDNSLADATPTSFKLKDGQDPVPTDEKQIKNGRFTITTPGDNFKVAGKSVAGFDSGTSAMTVNTALPAAPSDDDEVLIIP